ncbi:MAG: type II secretion system protein [Deltaproteobacteria bacterium]|nr:MAG: type II secretion system protein [Deltaproteobacteria bacterium]
MRPINKSGCRIPDKESQTLYGIFGTRQLQKGFTLIEMLVTIFIFAIIAATIFGSYNSVFSNAATIKDDMMAYEMAKSCLNRMILDLQSVYISLTPAYSSLENDEEPDPYRLVGEIIYIDSTPFPRLRFASLSHLPFGAIKQDGIAEIIYYVRSTRDGKYTLRRADNLILYGPAEEKEHDPILCENLKALAFKYYGSEGEAVESWDSEAEEFSYATPRAIEIKLVLGNDERFQEFKALVILQPYRDKAE